MRKKKRKRYGKYIFIVVVLIVILIYFVKTTEKEKNYEVIDTIELKSEKYLHGIIGNSVFTFEDNKLNIYSNEEIFTYIFSESIQDAWIDSAGEFVYVINKTDGKIYIFDEKANLSDEILLDSSRIISIKSDKTTGFIGFHFEEVNKTEQLLFLDNLGKEVGRIKGIKDGKVIDFAFDFNSNKVAVAVFSYDKGIKTNIFFANINGSIQGGKILNDEIVSKIFWTKEGELLCIGDKRILKLNRDKELIWENNTIADRGEYSSIAEVLVLSKTNIGKTEVIILNKENQVLLETSLDGSIDKIIANDKKTILYGKRTIYFVKNNNIEVQKIPKDIYWADILPNSNIVIGFGRKIEVLRIL